MAKKPMTKSQIVSYFADKFELTKKTSGIDHRRSGNAGNCRN